MDELAKKLTELTTQLAPPAFEAAKSAMRVQGWATLTQGLGLLGVAAVLALASYVCGRAARNYDADAFIFFGMIAAVGAAAMFLVAGAILTNPWTYVTITNPEVALAGKALGL